MNRKHEDVRHIQHYLMLSRRLDYRGGRKARSAERRMRELEKPLKKFVMDFVRDAHATGDQLLARMGVRRQRVGDEGGNG